MVSLVWADLIWEGNTKEHSSTNPVLPITGALAVAVGYAAEVSVREHRPITLADFPLVQYILKNAHSTKL